MKTNQIDMKRILKWIKQFFKDVWLGIKIGNEYQKKSQWGKF